MCSLAGTRNKKETIQFKKVIPFGTGFSGNTALFQTIKSAGTIQRIFGKFNQGQSGLLTIRPYLNMTGDRSEELVTYPSLTSQFMSGDNTQFELFIDFEVYPDDKIKLDVFNNSTTNDYTLDISFEVDYVGGTSRVV